MSYGLIRSLLYQTEHFRYYDLHFKESVEFNLRFARVLAQSKGYSNQNQIHLTTFSVNTSITFHKNLTKYTY